jgi:TP901 family phage tail tape measure protein
VNQLSLGVTIALRDAFSAKARTAGRGMSNLDDMAFRAARGISRSAGIIQQEIFSITRTFAAGFAAMGAVAYPVKKAMEFGAALAEVATIADYTKTNMAELRKEVLRQAFEYPTKPLEQVEALYRTISTGFIDGKEALKVLEAGTRVAVTTQTSVPDTLRALTGVLNAYSLEADHANDVTAKLFETVRYGRIRMDELGKYVGYGASAAGMAGVRKEDMLASVAAMTLGSLSPEQSFQYYRQLVIGTVKPTAQALKISDKYKDKGFRGIGKKALDSFDGNWSEWLKHAYDVIAVQHDNLEDFARLLSGRQAFAGAATLINMWDKFKRAREGIENPYVVDEHGVVITSQERAFRLMQRKLKYQVKQFKGAVEGVWVVLGEAGERILTPIVRTINKVVGAIQVLIDRFPIIQHAFFALGTTVSAGMLMFGLYQIQLLRTSAAWKKLTDASKLAQFRMFGLTLTAGATLKVFAALFIGVIAGAYALRKAFENNWRGIADKWVKFSVLMRAMLGAQRDGEMYWIDQNIFDRLKELGLDGIYVKLIMIRYRITRFWEGMKVGAKQFFNAFMSTIGKVFDGIVDILAKISGPLASRARAFFDSFKMTGTDVQRWVQMGEAFGRMAAAMIIIAAVMKTASFINMGRAATATALAAASTAVGAVTGVVKKTGAVGNANMAIQNATIIVRNGLVSGGAPGAVVGGGRRTRRPATLAPLALPAMPSTVARTKKLRFGSSVPATWGELAGRGSNALLNAYVLSSLLPGRAAGALGKGWRRTGGRAMGAMGRGFGRMRGFSPMAFLAGTKGFDRYNSRLGMFEQGYIGKGRHKGQFMRKGLVSPKEAGWIARARYMQGPAMMTTMSGLPGRAVAGTRAAAGRAAGAVTHGAAAASTVSKGFLKTLGTKLGPRALVQTIGGAFIAAGPMLARVLAGVFTGPIGWITLAITAAFSLMLLSIRSKFGNLGEYFRLRMPTWYGWFTGFFAGIGKAASAAWGGIKAGAAAMFESVKWLFDNTIGALFSTIGEFTGKIIGALGGWLQEKADDGSTWAKALLELGNLGRDATGLNNTKDLAEHRRMLSGQALLPGELSAAVAAIPKSISDSTDPVLRAALVQSDAYAAIRSNTAGNFDRYDAHIVRSLGTKLPVNPHALPDISKLHLSQLKEMQPGLAKFLGDNSVKSATRDSGDYNAQFMYASIAGFHSMLKREVEKREGSLLGAAAGLDPDAPPIDYEGQLGPTVEQATHNGIVSGMREAQRVTSVFDTPEYMALWLEKVENPFKQQYSEYSRALTQDAAVSAESVEHGRRSSEENMRELADAVRTMAQKGAAEAAVLLDGNIVGRLLRKKEQTHQEDHATRTGVQRVPEAA